jgi:ATP-binding cassette subfamily F protein 3
LLRSVCDELVIVHDGGVEDFARSLDDYPAWLADQEEIKAREAAFDELPATAKPRGKKEQRQQEARKRSRLKPLSDRVRQLDIKIDALRHELEGLELQLADETLYRDSKRKPELTALVKLQAEMRALLEQREWDWLEASEALEKAQAGTSHIG